MAVHALRLCQASITHVNDQISLTTLIGLLQLLAGEKAYNNVFLRHHVFCILQVAAGRLANLLLHMFHYFVQFITCYCIMLPLCISWHLAIQKRVCILSRHYCLHAAIVSNHQKLRSSKKQLDQCFGRLQQNNYNSSSLVFLTQSFKL